MTSPRGLRRGTSARRAADTSESPLILCAAQSAEISLQDIPQTFSVYVLKKISKSLLPNWATTQSSKLRGDLRGTRRAHAYESAHRAASRGPSLKSASAPF